MDNVVSQIMAQSDRSGHSPDIIIEFMGFAGHSVLGGHLHGKLRNTFPSAIILPVMMLPTDHVCEEWTRRYIWEQYESLLEGSNCLVTTQSSSVSGEDDLRLATGLAGIEMADFEEEETSDSPLAGACRRLIPASSGWLGMGIVKRSMPVTNRFRWLRFPPRWQQYAAIGPEDETYMSLGHAIWSTFDPSAQMAAGVNTSPNAPQGSGRFAAHPSRRAGTHGIGGSGSPGPQRHICQISKHGHRLQYRPFHRRSQKKTRICTLPASIRCRAISNPCWTFCIPTVSLTKADAGSLPKPDSVLITISTSLTLPHP